MSELILPVRKNVTVAENTITMVVNASINLTVSAPQVFACGIFLPPPKVGKYTGVINLTGTERRIIIIVY